MSARTVVPVPLSSIQVSEAIKDAKGSTTDRAR